MTGGRLQLASDAELVSLTQEGNLQAFNTLARKWDGNLYRFLRRIVGNEEDARDLCQETLVKAYVNIGRLRDPDKFSSWVHHIALNLCRDRFRTARSRSVQEPYEADTGEMRLVERRPAASPETHAHRTGLSEILDAALAGLPLAQRTAIVLREYQGFTTQEIAEITGVPAATIRTRIFYGLKSVRKTLQSRGVEPGS